MFQSASHRFESDPDLRHSGFFATKGLKQRERPDSAKNTGIQIGGYRGASTTLLCAPSMPQFPCLNIKNGNEISKERGFPNRNLGTRGLGNQRIGEPEDWGTRGLGNQRIGEPEDWETRGLGNQRRFKPHRSRPTGQPRLIPTKTRPPRRGAASFPCPVRRVALLSRLRADPSGTACPARRASGTTPTRP